MPVRELLAATAVPIGSAEPARQTRDTATKLQAALPRPGPKDVSRSCCGQPSTERPLAHARLRSHIAPFPMSHAQNGCTLHYY